MSNVTKCANLLLSSLSGARKLTGTTTKCATTLLKPQTQPRLFSLKSDSAIGTEITNNITGTRYFANSAFDGRQANVLPIACRINADGTFSSISHNLFQDMLLNIRKDPKAWNPGIKSKPDIGKEVIINRYGFDRYFRPAGLHNIQNDKITCIKQDGNYFSMTLKQFDDMLLDIFSGKK